MQVGNSYAKVLEASPTERRFLQEYLTFRSSNPQGRDLEHCLLSSTGMFPAGLAARVVSTARERGMDVLVAHRQRIVSPLSVPRDELWAHQVAALDKVWEYRRGIVQHVTGAGKGTTIAQLVAELNVPTLVLVTSTKLLNEMYDRIRKVAEITPGRFGGGYKELKKTVLVATFQSAVKLPKAKLDTFLAVLGDECHGSAGAQYYKVVLSCVNAEVRIGFSGTPLHRSDKKSIYTIGAFGEVIHKYSAVQSVTDGVTARAKLIMVPLHHHPVSAGAGYVAWEKLAIANNKTRNALLLRLIRQSPAPRIVFVRTHEHQKLLVKQLGASAVFVNDKVSRNDADRAIRQLVNGTVETLVSTPIFRQGVDIPEVATVIQGSGGKSVVDIIQKVGRGSRRHLKDGTTKDGFHVYDVYDRGCGCAGKHRHKGCQWLEQHSAARKEAYERFGYFVHLE